MDLRDHEMAQLREAEEIASEDETPDCARCEVSLGVFVATGQQDGFGCLACGLLLCRLCAEDHAREAHPLPYEAEVWAKMAAELRAQSLLTSILAALGVGAATAALWPYWERVFEVREPRVLVAAAILAGTSIAQVVGKRLLRRRMEGLR